MSKKINRNKQIIIEIEKLKKIANNEFDIIKNNLPNQLDDLSEKYSDYKKVKHSDLLLKFLKEIVLDKAFALDKKMLEKIAPIKPISYLKSYEKLPGEKKEESRYFGNNDFIAIKNKKKYYVNTINLEVQVYSEPEYKKILSLNSNLKKASDLNISPKLNEVFISLIKGEYNLIIVSDYEESENLEDFLKNNVLTQKKRKQMIDLLNKALNNGIIINYLGPQKFLIYKNGNIKISTLTYSQSVEELLNEKKERMLESFDYLTNRNNHNIDDIVSKKLIQEKKVKMI